MKKMSVEDFLIKVYVYIRDGKDTCTLSCKSTNKCAKSKRKSHFSLFFRAKAPKNEVKSKTNREITK